jgi:hypothetical protein
MKNFIKIVLIALVVVSCGDFEPVIYNPDTGQTGIGFSDSTAPSVIVPAEGISATVEVRATNTASTERSFDVSINAEESDDATGITLGSAIIPADSFSGELTVTFNNFDVLEEQTLYTLVVQMALPEGVAVVGGSEIVFNYNKYLICNDLSLVLNEDAYADERDWNITDSSGAIVLQCSDYDDCPTSTASGSVPAAQYLYEFTLPDGCYTFTISDSFGDGMFDGNISGNYTLSCSIIEHASGSGNWGSEEVTEFCVNP